MNATSGQPSFEFGGSEGGSARRRGTRREGREAVVRQVEYSPFPRVRQDQRSRMGFTRDLSDSGLCLRADEGRPPGSLLRVIVHRVDGRPALESIARIVWCGPGTEGGCPMGLSLLASRPRRSGAIGLGAGSARALRRAPPS